MGMKVASGMWRIETSSRVGSGTTTSRGLETSIVRVQNLNAAESKYSINGKWMLDVVLAEPHNQNYQFGAPFKIAPNHKKWLTCNSDEKIQKTLKLIQ